MVMCNNWMSVMRNIYYGDADAVPTHVAMGTGTTTVDASDTAMETEVFRKVIDSRSKTGSAKVRFQGTLSAAEGNGTTFTEIGVFNAVSCVTMMNHLTHTGILKADTFELRCQVEVENKDV